MSKQNTNFHSFPEEQILAKAYEIWQENKENCSPDENWQAAIEQLTQDRSCLNRLWQWTGFKEKKLWDFLQLLILPIGLVLVTFLLQQCVKQRELEVSDDKAKQETLVKYLDQMAELLKEGLPKSPINSEKFIIAQSATVTTLQSLDSKRQYVVIQFLAAANLNHLNGKGLLYKARMSKAQLSNSDLSGAVLVGANLRLSDFTNASLGGADLSGASLEGAKLDNAQLGDINLNSTNLKGASLKNAHLGGANLSRASLNNSNLERSELGGAVLDYADLGSANLQSVRFNGASLSGSLLSDANISGASFKGAKLNGANLSNVRGWNKQQVGSALLCKTKLPKDASLDPDRDCGKPGL
jgi:uncharacterized protein YjbI with pentapeptide repeats